MRPHAVFPLLAALLCGCNPKPTPARDPAVRDWEQVEYLSDHLAVACSGGTAWLITAEGDIVASDDDPDALKAGAEAAYARFLDEEYNGWEEILAQYDSLCSACIARRPADELLRRLDEITERLRHAVGRMDAQQQNRFAAIRDRYDRYRR